MWASFSSSFRVRRRVGHSRPALFLAAAAVTAGLGAPHRASAQTWNGAPGTSWNTATNWSPAVVPNSLTAAVNFPGVFPFYGVTITSSVSAQSLSFSNSTLGYSLTSSAGVSLSGVSAINVAPNVTATQLINLANVAGGSLFFPSGNLTITNDSSSAATTLAIGPSTVIGTPGFGGVVVDGAGTTEISGAFATGGGNNVVAGLTKNGPGTLILSNPGNKYSGATTVNGGTLRLGSGGGIRTGTNVIVNDGLFNIDHESNTAATAIATLALGSTATCRMSTGSLDYYLNQLSMTGGTVDFASTTDYRLHLTGSGASITTNASATTAMWKGGGTSRIQNDTATPLVITVAQGAAGLNDGVDLDAGVILYNGIGPNQGFVKAGAGTMRLTNTGNTATIKLLEGALRVDNVTTLGVGALGSGPITLSGGTLQYGGLTASTLKPLLLAADSTIQVLAGSSLTLTTPITETAIARGLTVTGPGTLTLPVNNNYSGATIVRHNGTLAIANIANGGADSPIGVSSSTASNLQLGESGLRGTLRFAGTNPANTSDRGVTLGGTFGAGGGGAIDVSNATTELLISGQITGAGSLIKRGAGALNLTKFENDYTGGTYVEAGTLRFVASGIPGGSSASIPRDNDVTVLAGATLDLGAVVNNNGTGPGYVFFGTLTLDGGALTMANVGRATFTLNNLLMTGGTVDFGSGVTSSLYVREAVTINASVSTSRWIHGQIGNPKGIGLPVAITVAAGTTASGIDLDVGGILIGQPFVKAGAGTMRLTGLGSTADLVIQQGALRVDDVTSGGVGVLGNGAITLNGGRLAYGGPTASLTKALVVASGGGGFDVLNPATTLTLSSPLVGDGALTKLGAGNLSLASLRVGGLAVIQGVVKLDPAGSGAAANQIDVLTFAGPGPRLDVTDNKLVLKSTPVGSWNGSTYTNVTGLIQSGRNGGSWNGSGIVTTSASGSLMTLGVATAQQAGRAGGTFGGIPVGANDTLVMFTYGGDANLDGKINVDDYGRIDFNVNLGTSGWFNGDFNYDGKINVDDYGIIDFNIGIQGAPFSTASQPLGAFANAAAPVAVPEPTAGALLGAIGWSFSLRQRRRSLSADHNSDRGSGRSHAMGECAENG